MKHIGLKARLKGFVFFALGAVRYLFWPNVVEAQFYCATSRRMRAGFHEGVKTLKEVVGDE